MDVWYCVQCTLKIPLLFFYYIWSYQVMNSWRFAFDKNRDPIILANNPPFSPDGVIGCWVCTMCDTSFHFVMNLYPSVIVSIIFLSFSPFSSKVESL